MPSLHNNIEHHNNIDYSLVAQGREKTPGNSPRSLVRVHSLGVRPLGVLVLVERVDSRGDDGDDER